MSRRPQHGGAQGTRDGFKAQEQAFRQQLQSKEEEEEKRRRREKKEKKWEEERDQQNQRLLAEKEDMQRRKRGGKPPKNPRGGDGKPSCKAPSAGGFGSVGAAPTPAADGDGDDEDGNVQQLFRECLKTGVGIDTTGDGRVDAMVYDTMGDGRVDGIDLNKDGRLDVEGNLGGKQLRKGIGLDITGDGKVDIVGYDTTGDGRIDAFDTNMDGQIDEITEGSNPGNPAERTKLERPRGARRDSKGRARAPPQGPPAPAALRGTPGSGPHGTPVQTMKMTPPQPASSDPSSSDRGRDPSTREIFSEFLAKGVGVDINGDGKANAVAFDTTGDLAIDSFDTTGDGKVDKKRGINKDKLRKGIGLDITGDGKTDIIAYDTTGDGKIDSFDTNMDGNIDTVLSPVAAGSGPPPHMSTGDQVLGLKSGSSPAKPPPAAAFGSPALPPGKRQSPAMPPRGSPAAPPPTGAAWRDSADGPSRRASASEVRLMDGQPKQDKQPRAPVKPGRATHDPRNKDLADTPGACCCAM